MITIDKDTLQDFDKAARREWLETNGIGGFASSTVLGLNTRRYHGLLTAATRPPAGRVVLLSKLEETLVIDDRRYDLSSNQYSGVVHPHGYTNLSGFRLDPFPIFMYSFPNEGVILEKSVLMSHGSNTALIRYRVLNGGSHQLALEARPLIAFRDYHALTHENGDLNRDVHDHTEHLVSVRPYADLPELFLAHDASDIDRTGYWYRNFEYAIEKERGLDSVEDLFSPFAFRFDLNSRKTATVIASTDPVDVHTADDLHDREIDRRFQILNAVSDKDPFVQTLSLAADQFIVNRGDEKTIIAGYHWFTDWGRDTMIALPGLTLATRRYDVARSILREFARHVDQGMLPNRFPDAGETPEYNTIDATLWYFEAVRAFTQYTNDHAFVRSQLYDVLKDIVEWHIRGTRYGIKLDADGLIASSDPTVQLTWMDAKIGDWVVTPRNGKAVEIQALWYNALRTMLTLARSFGDSKFGVNIAPLVGLARISFNNLFWNEQAACLYDCVTGSTRDSTLRPNQILAVSLTHSMLDDERAKQVVAAVENELFTPYGLRSLSPADPRYRGRYEGDSVARDSSYHQGPVWGWLMGPFITAYLKVHGNTADARRQAEEWLQSASSHLSEGCLGQIAEIFDGDAPHHPRGCAAQAWSVAELLRAAVEMTPAGKAAGR